MAVKYYRIIAIDYVEDCKCDSAEEKNAWMVLEDKVNAFLVSEIEQDRIWNLSGDIISANYGLAQVLVTEK